MGKGDIVAVILPPRFRSAAVPDGELDVRQVDGVGGISQLYRLDLQLQTVLPSMPYAPEQIDALLTENCVLELTQQVFGTNHSGVNAQIDFPFHGVLSELEIGSIEEAPGESAFIRYRATLVPRLWYATRSIRTRLFQGMSVPAIIRHILEETGLAQNLDFELRVQEPHPEREYVLQYRESDFQFLSRLAEEEGIFFFFEQTPEREVAIFADEPGGLPRYSLLESIDPDVYAHIRYEPRANFESIPGLRSLSRHYRKQLAGVVVHDYDYTHPDVSNHVVTRVASSGVGVVQHYLEGNEYTRADRAPAEPLNVQSKRIASLRAQERRLEGEVLHASSTVLGLFSGYTFELENHFDDSLVFASMSPEKRHRYLVTRFSFVVGQTRAAAEVQSAETLGFHADLTVVNAASPYRPPRMTARPVVAGLLTARVADLVRGPAPDLDEYGQYGLVLDVETIGAPALNGSTLRRFRMAQPFAGPSYGMHHPLHVGCEVLLAHLGGDPDRPIILAAVPNFAQRAPVDASNATHGGFRTRSNIIDFFNDDA